MAAWIIAQHEVLKLFGTRRGWLSLLAFALVWGILFAFVIEPAARLLSNQETTGLIGLLLGDQAGRVINNWRTLEVSLYWLVALYTMPFFAILMSADQIASDRSRGTLRYLTLRCSRLTLYFSRFIGQLVIMALLVAVTYVGSIAMSALHDVERAQQMLPDAPAVMINVWLVLMPYVALMSLLSVLARSSRQATVFSVVLWIGVWLAIRFVQNRFDSATWLSYADWIMPGAQIRGLLSLSDWETLQLAPIPLAHTVVLLLIGAVFMWKRDL
jgi:Cu-processing system permease protein